MAKLVARELTKEELLAKKARLEAEIAEAEAATVKPGTPYSSSESIEAGERPFRYGSMIGATVGSFAGSRFGEPGRVVGSGVGGAAGELGEQVYRGEVVDPGAIWNAGKENAIGEYLGDVASRAVVKGISPYGHRLVKDAKDIVSNLEAYGGFPTLDMIAKSGPVQFASRVVEKGAGSASKMGNYIDESVVQPIKRYGKDLRSGIGNYLPESVRGSEAKRFIDEGQILFHNSVKPFYQQADALFKKPVVDTTSKIKVLAQEYLDNVESFGSNSFIKDAEEILAYPNTITFGKAHRLRSNLLGLSRNQKEVMNSYDDAFVNRMRQAIDESMEDGALANAGQNSVAYQAYRDGAAAYREGAEIFGSRDIRDIMTSKDGVKAAAKLLPPKNPESVNRLFAAITKYNPSPAAQQFIKDVRASWFEDILSKKGLEVGDQSATRLGTELKDSFSKKLNAETILEEFNKYGDTFDVIAGADKAEISKFFRTLQSVENRTRGGGPGQVFMAMKYAGAPGAIGTGGYLMLSGHPMAGVAFAGSGTAIIVTPEILGKILTNKPMLKYLTNTIATPTRPALRELGRALGRYYANEGNEMKEERKGKIDSAMKYISELPSNL